MEALKHFAFEEGLKNVRRLDRPPFQQVGTVGELLNMYGHKLSTHGCPRGHMLLLRMCETAGLSFIP